jgi:serine/threonine-protein kinase RsbW
MERTDTVTIPSDLAEIPRVSARLEEILRAHAFLDEDIFDTQLAVEEAITNTIIHGYAENPGTITITIHASPGTAEIEIADEALPFNPLLRSEPDITLAIEDRQIGGLGIFLIRRLMNDLSYQRRDGKNILTLIKKKRS